MTRSGSSARGRRSRRATGLSEADRELVEAHLDAWPPLAKPSTATVATQRPRRLTTLARRGEVPVDVTVDLHGRTLEQALIAIDSALERARAQGLSILRVITGKGLHGGGDRAVLRDEIPPRLRLDPRVAEVVPAVRARDGGSGAWFVRLHA